MDLTYIMLTLSTGPAMVTLSRLAGILLAVAAIAALVHNHRARVERESDRGDAGSLGRLNDLATLSYVVAAIGSGAAFLIWTQVIDLPVLHDLLRLTKTAMFMMVIASVAAIRGLMFTLRSTARDPAALGR